MPRCKIWLQQHNDFFFAYSFYVFNSHNNHTYDSFVPKAIWKGFAGFAGYSKNYVEYAGYQEKFGTNDMHPSVLCSSAHTKADGPIEYWVILICLAQICAPLQRAISAYHLIIFEINWFSFIWGKLIKADAGMVSSYFLLLFFAWKDNTESFF